MSNNTKIFSEAIAEAKAIRETAMANAKLALEEAFAPRIQEMMSDKLEALAEKEEIERTSDLYGVLAPYGTEEEIDAYVKKVRNNPKYHGWYADDMIEDFKNFIQRKSDLYGVLAPYGTEEEIDAYVKKVRNNPKYHGWYADDMIEDFKYFIQDKMDSALEEEEVPENPEDYRKNLVTEEDEELDLEELLSELESLEEGEKEEMEEAKENSFTFNYNTDDDVEYIQDVLDRAGVDAIAKPGIDSEEMVVKAFNAMELRKAKKAIESAGFEINESASKGASKMKENTIFEAEDEDEVGEITVDELKDIIRDVIADVMGGESEKDVEGEEEGEEMASEDDLELEEILAEIEALGEEKSSDDESSMKYKAKEKELEEAMNTIATLRSELNEVNLLNAKLLYVNKLFKAKNLNESQKIKVINAFDRAETVREAKNVYDTLNESLSTEKAKSQIKESLSFASKPAGMAPNRQPIVENDDFVKRMQKIAGII